MASATLDQVLQLPDEEIQQGYLQLSAGDKADFWRNWRPQQTYEINEHHPRPRGGQRVVHDGAEIKVRVNREFLVKFDLLAKEEGKSREAIIRELMDFYVETHGAGAGLPTAAGLDRT